MLSKRGVEQLIMGTNFGIIRRKERNKEYEGVKWKSQSLHLLFYVAVAVQIFDVRAQFSRSVGFNFIKFAYIIIAVWAFFAVKNARKDSDEYEQSNNDYEMRHHFQTPKNIFIFGLISAAYIFLPAFLYLLDPINVSVGGAFTFRQAVDFLLAILPVWPIYIALRGRPVVAHRYVNLVIGVILIIFLFRFATTMNAGDVASLGGRSTPVDAGPVWSFLVESAQTGYKAFINSFKTVKLEGFFLKLANATGLEYYYGMNDQSDKGPVGLYLSNVRAIERYFYEDSPVVIWADIRGKSFTQEIHVVPGCYIDKIGEGIAEPSDIYILGEEHDTISCTFNDLPKGSYRAKVGVLFNFETWAYVTYTFVDQEIIRSLSIQGKNVNSQLDIPPLPEAVYSNGPVMLGMGSMVDQPIGVDKQNNIKEPILGVTLDNNVAWTEGKIKTPVHEFEIQIPNDFELVNCDSWGSEKKRPPYKSVENYDFYKFTPQEFQDDRAEYTSVTCRLHIKSPTEFLSGAQKVQRTFVARASYDYVLEHPLSIIVRE
jgi:hypothetical protein